MNLKHTLLAAGLALALGATALAPQAAHAADSGTITINGKVLSSTCNVTSGGSAGSSFTVSLPDVQSSALSTAGNTAGATAFALSLSGCPTTPSGVQVGAQFYSAANTDTTTGTLKNTGVTNVDVQLMSVGGTTGTTPSGANTGGTAVTIATASPTGNSNVTDPVTLTSAGTATLNYYAQYYATGAAGAGAVSTTVNYLINYQ